MGFAWSMMLPAEFDKLPWTQTCSKWDKPKILLSLRSQTLGQSSELPGGVSASETLIPKDATLNVALPKASITISKEQHKVPVHLEDIWYVL